MRLDDVKRRQNKDVVITIRTTRQNMEFIKVHDISPSRLFNKAIEDVQKYIAEDGLKKLATPKRK